MLKAGQMVLGNGSFSLCLQYRLALSGARGESSANAASRAAEEPTEGRVIVRAVRLASTDAKVSPRKLTRAILG